MADSDARPAGRAILTYARGHQSLAAVRSLGRRGVEVVTGDEYALALGSLSKYSIASFRYPSPTAKPAEFLDKLEEVILEHKPADPDVPYVLITIHKEGYVIARHRERFEPHIRVPLPDIAQIEQVHNKGTLAAYAMERGLPMPRTWMPESVDALKACIGEIPLPSFVKLRAAASGVGIRKVDTAEELLSTFEEFIDRYHVAPKDYPIVQEGVPGDDYCVTTLFDRGALRACMTYRNIRAFPAERGAGVLRETVEAPAMERICADLLGPLGWHGVAEIDFRWDGLDESEPQLIEVNPRFWGGLNQAIASGWDYPWLLYRLAVDGRVDPPGETRTDVRTEAPILGLLATLQEIAQNDRGMNSLKGAWSDARQEFREGSKRAGIRKLFSGLKKLVKGKDRVAEAKRLLEVHKHTVFDVLSSRDPLPLLGVLYPLAVFLKHGKVNLELITGEGGPEVDDEPERAGDDGAEA